MVVQCKPLTKDHLPLKTAFSGPKGWSLVTDFTVHVNRESFHNRKREEKLKSGRKTRKAENAQRQLTGSAPSLPNDLTNTKRVPVNSSNCKAGESANALSQDKLSRLETQK